MPAIPDLHCLDSVLSALPPSSWITDPNNGLSNVKSEILLGVWDRFHQNGVEIPFPQRDLHMRSSAKLHVVMQRPLKADVSEGDTTRDAAE